MGPSTQPTEFDFGVIWVPTAATFACALFLFAKLLQERTKCGRTAWLGRAVLLTYCGLRATAEGFAAQRKGLNCNQEEFVFNLLASEISVWYYLCFLSVVSAKFRQSTWRAHYYPGFLIFAKFIVLLILLITEQPSSACVLFYSLLSLAILHHSHMNFAVHAWSPRPELPIRVTLILTMTYSAATYVIAFRQVVHIIAAVFMDARAVLCDTAATGTLLSLAFRDSIEIAFVFETGTFLWTQSWTKGDAKSSTVGRLLSYFIYIPITTVIILLPFALMGFAVESVEDLSHREPWLRGGIVTALQVARCTAVLCTLFTVFSRALVVRYVLHFLYRYFGATTPSMHSVTKVHVVVSLLLVLAAVIHMSAHIGAQSMASQYPDASAIRPIYRSPSSLFFSLAGLTGIGMMIDLVLMVASGCFAHGVERRTENANQRTCLSRRRAQCLPHHGRLANAFTLKFIIHGAQMEFGIFPANAAFLFGAVVLLLIVDTVCGFVFPRYFVELPRIKISASPTVDFLRDGNGYMKTWGTHGPSVDLASFLHLIKKGPNNLMVCLRLKRPAGFAHGGYPGEFVTLLISDGMKNITYEACFSIANWSDEYLDFVIHNDESRDVAQSWTSNLVDKGKKAAALHEPSTVEIGIRGPIAGPISAALRMSCESSGQEPFILIIICSGTGIAVGSNIIQSGVRSGWVPKHLVGLYFIQLGTRDLFDVAAGEYSPDLYFQHVLLPRKWLFAWNRRNPHAPAKFFGCDLFHEYEPDDTYLAQEPDDSEPLRQSDGLTLGVPLLKCQTCRTESDLLKSSILCSCCHGTEFQWGVKGNEDEEKPTQAATSSPSVEVKVDGAEAKYSCPLTNPRTQKAYPKRSNDLFPANIAHFAQKKGAKRIVEVKIVSESALEKTRGWSEYLNQCATGRGIEMVTAVELFAPLRIP